MEKQRQILVAENIPEFHASIEAMPLERKIFVDKSLEIANRLFYLMQLKGITEKELARKTDLPEAEIANCLGGMRNYTLRTIATLEAAIGQEIIKVSIV